MSYVIYGEQFCKWTEKAMQLLEDYNEEYTFINLRTNDDSRDWLENYLSVIQKTSSTPQIFYSNTYIGDYYTLSKYMETHGKL